jgi:hypothetical protein
MKTDLFYATGMTNKCVLYKKKKVRVVGKRNMSK